MFDFLLNKYPCVIAHMRLKEDIVFSTFDCVSYKNAYSMMKLDLAYESDLPYVIPYA